MLAADIIILGFIAGFILYRLYVTIGQRDDDGSVNNFTSKDHQHIIDISSIVKAVEETPELSVVETELGKNFEQVLAKIRASEPGFSLEKFLDGAKKAFELILISFAENNRQILASLLSEEVYKQFVGEIEKRLANNISLNLTLVSIPKIEIKDIRLANNIVSIDVFYNSQQITLLKDSNNKVVEGDASQIDNVEDFWTYSKELNSGNNWLLVKVNAA
jgi:predicted lipid-binding transport protein (Tim44 family)